MNERTDRGFSSLGCWSGFCSKNKQEEEEEKGEWGNEEKGQKGKKWVEEEWRRRRGRKEEEEGSSSKLRRALVNVSKSSSSLHSFPGSLLLPKFHQEKAGHC